MNNFNIKSDINNKMYHVFIHNVSINSIKKSSDVDDFLSKNVNNVKILLVPNVNKKILTQVLTKYPNSEVFRFSEMLENITEKIFIPKHTLMDEKSKEELLLRIYKIIRTGTERSWQSILFLYNERSYTIRNTIYSI